jgi:hypothetical protein
VSENCFVFEGQPEATFVDARMDLDIGCVSGICHLVEPSLPGACEAVDSFVGLATIGLKAGMESFVNGSAAVSGYDVIQDFEIECDPKTTEMKQDMDEWKEGKWALDRIGMAAGEKHIDGGSVWFGRIMLHSICGIVHERYEIGSPELPK